MAIKAFLACFCLKVTYHKAYELCHSHTYSMHLVLLTGGWQGGGGLRKMGSFTTIRALSSELKHGRAAKEKHRVAHKINFAGLFGIECICRNV